MTGKKKKGKKPKVVVEPEGDEEKLVLGEKKKKKKEEIVIPEDGSKVTDIKIKFNMYRNRFLIFQQKYIWDLAIVLYN